MTLARIPAVFYRGGTSKAVVFHARDLPSDPSMRDKIFLHVMGSPDPYKRQLDGMGGGLSSLSKVVIVEPSTRSGIDVDYTFAQVAVDRAVVDYDSMCGNMSACVGPFAIDEGLVAVAPAASEASVSVFNTNTQKHYTMQVPVANGSAVECGEFSIPGVSTTGAKIRLDYADPGGAVTGRTLPAGDPVTKLEIDGVFIEASLVDVSNPVVFIRASDVGKNATELPQDLDADEVFMQRVEMIRRAAAVAMGLADTREAASLSAPKMAIVAPPDDFSALDGQRHQATDFDIAVRIVSMGNVHRAITLTGAMCVAAAVRIPGTIPNRVACHRDSTLIGNPSGLLPVQAEVETAASINVVSTTTWRTQRRIMEGSVLVPASIVSSNETSS